MIPLCSVCIKPSTWHVAFHFYVCTHRSSRPDVGFCSPANLARARASPKKESNDRISTLGFHVLIGLSHHYYTFYFQESKGETNLETHSVCAYWLASCSTIYTFLYSLVLFKLTSLEFHICRIP